MNVTIISGTFPNLQCGVGDYTFSLCFRLKKYDINLNIITSQDPLIKPLEGVKVFPLLKNWNFLSIFTLINFFKNNPADIIHIQYPTQSYKDKLMINILPLFLKTIFPRIRLIATIHDTATAHFLNKLRILPFLICADMLIVTTGEEKEYLTKRLPWLGPKIKIIFINSSIIPCKLSAEEREAIREELGVEKNEILLLHFGYILPKKKLEILLYTLERFLREGQHIKFLFISDFCPQRNKYHRRLENLSKTLGLNKNVIWLGYCSNIEVSRYICSADISVQVYPDGVSYRRGSFITVLASGLPVITTMVKKLPGGLKNRQNVLAVRVNNIDELVSAIKELIASGELRMNLSNNAKILAQSFSWENIAREHFELYQGIVTGNK